MSHLTNKIGSQHLAMVAYNGGEKAIKYVEKNIDGSVTLDKWMDFMEQERQEKGVGTRNLWRNQTFEYIAKIDPAYWDLKTLARAEQMQSAELHQFNNGGVAVADASQPNPLTTAFDGKGVDQIATAQQTNEQIPLDIKQAPLTPT